MNKVGSSSHIDQMLWRFAEAHPFFFSVLVSSGIRLILQYLLMHAQVQ